MAATVKTLLENQPEIFWGSFHDEEGYHFGISLDYRDDTLILLAVYVMSDFDEEGDPLVTPDVLADCYTIEDLEKHDIVLSDLMDDEDSLADGWYCAELSVFRRSAIDAIRKSSEHLGDYLETVVAILEIDPSEMEKAADAFGDVSFFEMQRELESIPANIDAGRLAKPLPFEFRLVGDALFGWENVDEGDYR